MVAYERSGRTASNPEPEPSASIYKIRVKGCLDQELWRDWFGGMQISLEPGLSETVLVGPVADQAELYGLLSRLRNNGLALISVEQVSQAPSQGIPQ